MSEPKKKALDEKVSAKIQAKFDLVFGSSNEIAKKESTVFNDGPFSMDGDVEMSSGTPKKSNETQLKIDLDFNFDSDGTQTNIDVPAEENKSSPRLSVVPDTGDDIGFDLDFSNEAPDVPQSSPAKSAASTAPGLDLGGDDISFELDSLSETAKEEVVPVKESAAMMDIGDDIGGLDMDEMLNEAIAQREDFDSDKTQKTIVFDKSQLKDIGINDVGLSEKTGSSAELMSVEEAKANMDATIKDIIRPKLQDSTQELDISTFSTEEETGGFSLEEAPKVVTGEFDLSSVDFADKEEDVVVEDILRPAVVEEVVVARPAAVPARPKETPKAPASYVSDVSEPVRESPRQSFISDEDSSRFQATIRQLREEREGLLAQLKELKAQNRELEQDNLTLKASLDETKIEISILRKRHLVEMEDMKYRLSVNEEKRDQALERARQAEMKREKLEQKVRIDFNQVKQREKELETKLEMLTIDVDAQVHSRDQKILELRRKIDALEFNMENVSIKEHKSIEDKRKLEDKLNKIMKTLRHSIKNLEDDMDMGGEVETEKAPGEQRSNKA